MALQLVPDQRTQIENWGPLAIDSVQRVWTSWKEAPKATTTPKVHADIRREIVEAFSIDREIREFERDVLEVERRAVSIEAFVERVRLAGKDDKKAKEFDELSEDPDLSNTLEIFEREYVIAVKQQMENLVERAERWPTLANSKLLRSSLPNSLVWRVNRLDTQLNECAEELYKEYDNVLIMRLFARVAKYRLLSLSELLRLDDAAKLEREVVNQPSVRRKDWYGEDG